MVVYTKFGTNGETNMAGRDPTVAVILVLRYGQYSNPHKVPAYSEKYLESSYRLPTNLAKAVCVCVLVQG
jgi:hypothetical protein